MLVRMFSSAPALCTEKKAVSYSCVTALLEETEKRHYPNEKRQRYHYSANLSASVALPYLDEEWNLLSNDKHRLLQVCEEHVKQHATRRVDLFFYTLIAYYKKELVVSIGKTTLQHGRGRSSQLQACHSSLFPSLIDNSIFNQIAGERPFKSILSGTHFFNSLNLTFELPIFVNQFDSVIESNCRKKALDVLNETSFGVINPIEGLTDFLNMMQTTLNRLQREMAHHHNKSVLSNQAVIEKAIIDLRLLELTKTGTLERPFLQRTQAASDAYIESLLRMTPEEQMGCQRSQAFKEECYLKKILQIQDEILHKPIQDGSARTLEFIASSP